MRAGGAIAGARDGRGGFALVEVMIALLLIALLAALAMPGLVRATGPGTLRIAAMEVTALLRDQRNAALGSGRPAAAGVDAAGRLVRSVTSAVAVAMPPGAMVGPRGATVRFTPDGRASGGPLLLQSSSAAFAVAVDSETGAISVSAR